MHWLLTGHTGFKGSWLALQLIEAGGNAYYLAKLAGILGLNVQDIGAQQTGMSVEAFKQKLLDQARQ